MFVFDIMYCYSWDTDQVMIYKTAMTKIIICWAILY